MHAGDNVFQRFTDAPTESLYLQIAQRFLVLGKERVAFFVVMLYREYADSPLFPAYAVLHA